MDNRDAPPVQAELNRAFQTITIPPSDNHSAHVRALAPAKGERAPDEAAELVDFAHRSDRRELTGGRLMVEAPEGRPSAQEPLAQLEKPLQSRQPALSFSQVRSSPSRHSLVPSLGQRLSQRHSPEARSQYPRAESRHGSGTHRGPLLPPSTPGASELVASEAGVSAPASKAGSAAVGGARLSEQLAPEKQSKKNARESVCRLAQDGR